MVLSLSQEQILLPAVAVTRTDGSGPVKKVDSWQGYLIELAYHLRHVVREDPGTAQLLTRPPAAAWWLRPAVADLDLVENFYATTR